VRDVILLAAILGIIPVILGAPQVGVIIWTWVSLMSPQREVYTFLNGFEFNFYVTLLTCFAWVISREPKSIILNPVTALLVLFGIWVSITTYLALVPAYSELDWDRTVKTIILTVAILAVINTKVRIQGMIWVIVISLGFFAVKGGGFTLYTGGAHTVFGPQSSMIADNNNLGLALVMVLPLINYLRTTSRQKFVSVLCFIAMGLTLVAIIGTYSRGALLALGALGAFYAVRSRAGFLPLVLGVLLVVALPRIVPSAWFDRMSTISTANEDASFEGRLAAWKTSWNVAKARPILGGGFSSIQMNWVTERYSSPGSLTEGKAAHSIYFELLGDHGFVGLFLYLALVLAAVRNTMSVIRHTARDPTLYWARELARTMQACIVGFLVGGAALSMAYYDGFLILLALTASLEAVVRRSEEPVTSRPWSSEATSALLHPSYRVRGKALALPDAD
jgi:probable O-glycosylation ligase (exosortase A-associated)